MMMASGDLTEKCEKCEATASCNEGVPYIEPFLIPILSRRTEVDHQAKSWPLLAKKKPPGCPKSGSDTNVPVFKSVASPHH